MARSPLTRNRILDAAMAFVDERGVGALKMRELASSLGYEAMALYRHLKNKEAIVEGLLDRVLEEIEPASAEGEWRMAIRRSALSAYEALSRHPWATPLLLSPLPIRLRRLRYLEALLACLKRAGLSQAEVFQAYHVLDAYIFGYAVWQDGHLLTGPRRAEIEKLAREATIGADFPNLAEHRDLHFIEGPHRDADGFEVGLDLLLEALG
jgi:AcrR family transcriptional regulator